jgi:hypothetical protein
MVIGQLYYKINNTKYLIINQLNIYVSQQLGLYFFDKLFTNSNRVFYFYFVGYFTSLRTEYN